MRVYCELYEQATNAVFQKNVMRKGYASSDKKNLHVGVPGRVWMNEWMNESLCKIQSSSVSSKMLLLSIGGFHSAGQNFKIKGTMLDV